MGESEALLPVPYWAKVWGILSATSRGDPEEERE